MIVSISSPNAFKLQARLCPSHLEVLQGASELLQAAASRSGGRKERLRL